MNLKQLQYALVLSKVRNFSQASAQLNISQPALSKQIMALENELGVKLFDRACTPLELTPAGEYFFSEAQNLVNYEQRIQRTIAQYASGERGRLTIGVSPFRNLYLMPRILETVRQKYPGLQIEIRESASDQLKQEAAEGKFDFAIVNLPVDESALTTTLLEPEVLVLAVPTHLAQALPGYNEDSPQISIADCGDMPFVVVSKGQEMRRIFDNLCANADLVPNIAVEVYGGVTTAYAMAHGGLGATLLPLQFAKKQLFDERLTFFTLKGNTFRRQPAIVARQGQYLSEYARYAISLLTGQ